jgi:hypothetical protein
MSRSILPSRNPTLHHGMTLRDRLRHAVLAGVTLFAIAGFPQPHSVVAQETNATDLLVGKAFEDALEQTISVTWQAQDLRSGLKGLSNARRVSILIDRRVDPSTELSLTVKSVPLRELLDRVAADLSLGISRLENTIVIGPRESTRRLRTDVELAAGQLVKASSDGGRVRALQRKLTLNWPDLTSPRELLDEVARRYELKIDNAELVPHDLWAAGALPSSNAAESLTVVLSQFDMAFEWSADLQSVRLVEQPRGPALEREFALRRGVAASIVDELRESLPGVTLELRGRRVSASGLFEELEQVQAALNPSVDRPTSRPTGPKVTTFTFEVRNAPLLDFMEKLEQQAGYSFEYDADQLVKAGVKLDGAVSLKMKDALPDELFKAMFDPLGLRHEVDGTTVRLRLKSRTDE